MTSATLHRQGVQGRGVRRQQRVLRAVAAEHAVVKMNSSEPRVVKKRAEGWHVPHAAAGRVLDGEGEAVIQTMARDPRAEIDQRVRRLYPGGGVRG